jgi:hypothetical protein
MNIISMHAHGFKLLFAVCFIFCLQCVLYFVCSVFYILFAACFIFCFQRVLYFVCSVFYILFADYFVCSLFYILLVYLQRFICMFLQQISFSLLQFAIVCDIHSVDSGVPSGPP